MITLYRGNWFKLLDLNIEIKFREYSSLYKKFLIPSYFKSDDVQTMNWYSLLYSGKFDLVVMKWNSHQSSTLSFLAVCRVVGVGYAICLLDIYMGMYYNTIIGWAVYYLFASFRSELPWTSCDNPWNTFNCTPVMDVSANNTTSVSPAKEFFEWVPYPIQSPRS